MRQLIGKRTLVTCAPVSTSKFLRPRFGSRYAEAAWDRLAVAASIDCRDVVDPPLRPFPCKSRSDTEARRAEITNRVRVSRHAEILHRIVKRCVELVEYGSERGL